jgi:hypothetical protein
MIELLLALRGLTEAALGRAEGGLSSRLGGRRHCKEQSVCSTTYSPIQTSSLKHLGYSTLCFE